MDSVKKSNSLMTPWLILPALLGSAVGLLLLLGWHLGVTAWVKSWIDGAPISYNEGVCLLFSGISLWAMSQRRQILTLLFSAPLGLISALSLIQFFPGAGSVGVDTLLWPYSETLSDSTITMSLLGSLSFVLVFLGVIFLPFVGKRYRSWFSLFWGALLIAVGLSCGFGLLVGLPEIAVWSGKAEMGIQVALGIAAFGLVFVGAGLSSEWNFNRREWCALPIVTAVLCSTLLFWVALKKADSRRVTSIMNAKANDVGLRIKNRIAPQLAPVVRMSERWKLDGRPQREDWEREVGVFMKHFDAYQYVGWVDAEFRTVWDVHSKGAWAEGSLDLELALSAPEVLREVRETGETRFLWGKDLVHDGLNFLALVPLFNDGLFDGYLLSILGIRELMSVAISLDENSGFGFLISHQGSSLYERLTSGPNRFAETESSMEVYGLPLKLRVWAGESQFAKIRSRLPEAIFGLGILLAALIGHLVRISIRLRNQNSAIEVTSQFLESSEDQLRVRSIELDAAMDETQRNVQSKNRLIEEVGRALMASLNRLVGLGELLQGTKLTKLQKEYVEGIGEVTLELECLANGVLDVSRPQGAELTLDSATFSLRDLVEQISSDCSPSAQAKGLRWVTVVQDEVPDVLQGDLNRLKEVLRGLCYHSIRVTEEGSVELHVRTTGDNGSVASLRFEVRDTASYRSEQVNHDLFESLARFKSREESPVESLNYVLSESWVQMMGGELFIESQPAVGTTVHFEIELLVASPESLTLESKSQARWKGKGSILVYGVDPSYQRIQQQLLEKMGLKVFCTSSHVEAAKRISEESFDYILVDGEMPSKEVVSVVRQLRRKEKSETPATILTSLTSSIAGEREEFLQAGVDGFLSEPIGVKSLSEAFRHFDRSHLGSVEMSKPSRSGGKSREQLKELIDRSVLFSLRLLEGEDSTFFPRLIEEFEKSAKLRVTKISKLISKKSWKSLGQESQLLKEESSHMGAIGMMALCEEIHQKAKSGKVRGIVKLGKDLESNLNEVLTSLRSEIKDASKAA